MLITELVGRIFFPEGQTRNAISVFLCEANWLSLHPSSIDLLKDQTTFNFNVTRMYDIIDESMTSLRAILKGPKKGFLFQFWSWTSQPVARQCSSQKDRLFSAPIKPNHRMKCTLVLHDALCPAAGDPPPATASRFKTTFQSVQCVTNRLRCRVVRLLRVSRWQPLS